MSEIAHLLQQNEGAVRDVAGMALKALISSVTPNSIHAAFLSQLLVPVLITQMKNHDGLLDVVDIIAQLLACSKQFWVSTLTDERANPKKLFLYKNRF